MKTRLGWFCFIFAAATHAQAGFNAQPGRITQNDSYVLLEDARWSELTGKPEGSELGLRFGLRISSTENPMTRVDAFGTQRTAIVERVTAIEPALSVDLSRRIRLGLDLPMDFVTVRGAEERFGFGDARLLGKFMLSGAEILSSALLTEIYFPTGKKSLYVSTGELGFGAGIALEKSLGKVSVVANGIYRAMPGNQQGNIDHSQKLTVGAGGVVEIGPKVRVRLEGMTDLLLSQSEKSGAGEVYVGAGLRVFRGGELTIGASFGRDQVTEGISPRGILGFKVHPVEEEKVETQKEIRTVVVQPDCGNRPFTRAFHARPISLEELTRIHHLPYRSTGSRPVPLLQLGQGTGVSASGIRYVKDSQVVFAIDLTDLPSREALVEIHEASLRLDVTKVSRDSNTGSELLCLIDQKVCSGEMITDRRWKANVDERFFEGRETPNDFFSKQYLEKKVDVLGTQGIYSSQVVLPLERIIENSLYPDPAALFYEDLRKWEPLEKKTLSFVVSDDTFVSNEATLVLSYVENTCESRRNPR